ncbi:polysaccharide biosynthesis/export family protein [Prosthecobacter sp.]|uniref:polysaccharide biosynthesis/export family protein n=1 Tax=Prosthecobacter sp. TaxID=1965333 RepID=UPI003785064D
MNKRANILLFAVLCFALTSCSPYDEHEAKVTARMIERLQDERAFMVTGVVVRPGKYYADGSKETKVSQAIQQAGGFAQFANKRRVILRRGTGGSMQRIFVNLDEKYHSRRSMPDITIWPGDVIIVEERKVSF